jgi:hypothetical protein
VSLEYIRRTYGVPAKRGAAVRFKPDSRDRAETGKVIGSKGALLRVRLEGHKRIALCHPTWAMEDI